tara:strand:+ start:223 stop:600 length:378 start_codon:yes stop_codon:yes gene_type:complete
MTIAGTLITCATLIAVDGDTAKCDGENLRPMGDGAPHVSGFDTPEIRRPRCAQEALLAAKAMARFAELIATPNLRIYDSGERDNTQTHRRLVWMILPDGRSVGQTLIDEGLAVVWTPDYRANWCK